MLDLVQAALYKNSTLARLDSIGFYYSGAHGPPYFLLGTRPLLASCFKMFSNYLGFMALCDVPFIAYLFMQAKWLP